MILRMHNPNPRQGAGNGASPAKSQMLKSRSPLKRQQSTAFTDPYTDKSRDYAGFVTRKNNYFPADGGGKKVAWVPA